MRKLIILIICFFCIINVSSCKKKIILHEYTIDYLSLLKASECKINDLNKKKIKEIQIQLPLIDLLSISEKIGKREFLQQDEVLCSQKENDIIEENDLVDLTLYYVNDSQRTCFNHFFVVASEHGESLPELQEKLVGKKKGDKDNVGDLSVDDHRYLSPEKMSYTVERIYKCNLRKKENDTFANQDLYATVIQYYDYLFQKRILDAAYNCKFQLKQDYLSACLEACQFSYSEEQIEAIAKKYLKDYQEAAQTLGMTLKDYWHYKQDNAIGAPVHDDPYINAVMDAEREVGTVLFVGAIAKEKGLTVSDEEVQKTFNETHWIGFGDTISYNNKVTLRYQILTEKVIAELLPEYNQY